MFLFVISFTRPARIYSNMVFCNNGCLSLALNWSTETSSQKASMPMSTSISVDTWKLGSAKCKPFGMRILRGLKEIGGILCVMKLVTIHFNNEVDFIKWDSNWISVTLVALDSGLLIPEIKIFAGFESNFNRLDNFSVMNDACEPGSNNALTDILAPVLSNASINAADNNDSLKFILELWLVTLDWMSPEELLSRDLESMWFELWLLGESWLLDEFWPKWRSVLCQSLQILQLAERHSLAPWFADRRQLVEMPRLRTTS